MQKSSFLALPQKRFFFYGSGCEIKPQVCTGFVLTLRPAATSHPPALNA